MCLPQYGPPKTICTRFIAWSRFGVFNKIFAALAAQAASPILDDRCDLSEGPSDGRQPLKKGTVPRRIGHTKGGLNSKLHVVCDGKGRPLIMLLQRRADERLPGRAALMIEAFPKAKVLLGDKGYDVDWFRASLGEREIIPCIRSQANRKVPIRYDPASSGSMNQS